MILGQKARKKAEPVASRRGQEKLIERRSYGIQRVPKRIGSSRSSFTGQDPLDALTETLRDSQKDLRPDLTPSLLITR